MTSEREQAQSTADIAYGDRTDDTVIETADDGKAPMMSDGGTEAAPETADTSLLPQERTDEFNQRWTVIQGAFVDAPREAVQNADSLVAEVIQDLAKMFADERASLEGQWEHNEDVDTEALRVALQRYRSFFHRLLAA